METIIVLFTFVIGFALGFYSFILKHEYEYSKKVQKDFKEALNKASEKVEFKIGNTPIDMLILQELLTKALKELHLNLQSQTNDAPDGSERHARPLN